MITSDLVALPVTSSPEVSCETPVGWFWTQQTIEELDAQGFIIKTVALDYLIVISDPAAGPPPGSSTNSPMHIVVPPGGNVNFSVTFTSGGSTSSAIVPSANGSDISVSVVGVPEGADVGCDAPSTMVTCVFSWMPGQDQSGSFVVTFIATTEGGAQTFISFTIEVTGDPAGPQTCPAAIEALQQLIDDAPGITPTMKILLKVIVAQAERGGPFLQFIERGIDFLLNLEQITEEQADEIRALIAACEGSGP